MKILVKPLLGVVQRLSGTLVGFAIQKLAYAVYRQSFNPGYRFDQNGELHILSQWVKRHKQGVIADVGANVGHWSLSCAELAGPGAEIFAFEPGNKMFDKLKTTTASNPRIVPVQLGLSDTKGILELAFDPRAPEKSSVEAAAATVMALPASVRQIERQNFVRGDDYFHKRGVDRIGFLKVDTEGHDYKVLKGFSGMIARGSVDMIQFEYNRLNIIAKAMLADFYQLLNEELTANGYVIGRIYPRGVRFKSYHPTDENFIDGNFVAVRQELAQLVDALRCR